MRQRAFSFVLPLLIAGAAPLAAQEPLLERLDVAGLVADAATGEPLASVSVVIAGTALRTLTNDDGRFVLRGIPRGEHTWIIERLGYATWEQSLEVEHLDQLKIGLLARPVALEAIRVTVNRLEERRKLAPVAVHTADRASLRTSIAIDAAELARSRMHWLPAVCPSRSGGSSARGASGARDESSLVDPASVQGMSTGLCIRSRGGITQPRIYLDERPVPYALLVAYGADEIFEIDYFGGGPTAEIRLYTRHFLESGKPIRPFGF